VCWVGEEAQQVLLEARLTPVSTHSRILQPERGDQINLCTPGNHIGRQSRLRTRSIDLDAKYPKMAHLPNDRDLRNRVNFPGSGAPVRRVVRRSVLRLIGVSNVEV
jgi:hypothetical protein